MGIIDGAGNHHHGKGTPDGGRFAAKTNSAPGKELTDSATVNMDTVPVRVAWIEPNVLPTPRHRLPRSITRELDTAVDIPVLTEEEAPTGFLLKKRRRTGIEKLELRVHDGRLYRRTWKEYTPEKLLNLISISERDKPLIVGDSEEEVQANLRERADEFVVIGDEIWKETPEPVYYAQTFGLGGVGNGGTSLFIGHAGDFASEDHTTPEYVFPAHQREEAIWYTRQLAEQRGDLHSIDHIGKDIFIELTDQFEPGSTFRAAPRMDYTHPNEAIYGGDASQVRAEFDRFKAQLLTVPGAVVDVDDGWGGRTKTVDTRVLSEKQARDYDEYVRYVSKLHG